MQEGSNEDDFNDRTDVISSFLIFDYYIQNSVDTSELMMTTTTVKRVLKGGLVSKCESRERRPTYLADASTMILMKEYRVNETPNTVSSKCKVVAII